MFGIALALVPDGLVSVKDIIKRHHDVGNEFYISTSYRIDKKKLEQSEKILLYSKNENLYYVGDIVRTVHFGLNKDVPQDAEKYSPKDYAEMPERVWILVKNLEKKNLSDLNMFSYRETPINELIDNAKRGTMFYFSDN